MNTICRDIFRAIHEGKWLSIEYKNEQEKITKYWVAVISINLAKRTMQVEGLHLAEYTVMELKIRIDSIQSSSVIEGSYYKTDDRLLEDIRINPHKYESLFHNVANLKILNYLSDCNKLDNVPYKTEYALIHKFDGDCVKDGRYTLSGEQFQEIVTTFQYGAKSNSMNQRIKQLALNVLSIHTKQGLYVLAYRLLRLDVKSRSLRQEDDVTICTEYTINGNKQSIRQFLDAEDYALLEDFEKNQQLP